MQANSPWTGHDREEQSMGSVSVVGVAGSVRQPSRSAVLVGEMLSAITARLDAPSRLIELVDDGVARIDGLAREHLAGDARAIVEAIETADILVVGTPVYRASYTGLFKQAFDLVDQNALTGTTVVLTATGGSPLHGLVMEHQLRPLFGFFRAQTVPSAVYATEADFTAFTLSSVQVRERIGRAADEAVRLAATGHPVRLRPRSAAVLAST